MGQYLFTTISTTHKSGTSGKGELPYQQCTIQILQQLSKTSVVWAHNKTTFSPGRRLLWFQNYICILAYGSPKGSIHLQLLKSYNSPPTTYLQPVANLLHFIQYICCELWLEFTDFVQKQEKQEECSIQISPQNTCINYLVLLGNNKKRSGMQKVSVYFLLILACSFSMC